MQRMDLWAQSGRETVGWMEKVASTHTLRCKMDSWWEAAVEHREPSLWWPRRTGRRRGGRLGKERMYVKLWLLCAVYGGNQHNIVKQKKFKESNAGLVQVTTLRGNLCLNRCCHSGAFWLIKDWNKILGKCVRQEQRRRRKWQLKGEKAGAPNSKSHSIQRCHLESISRFRNSGNAKMGFCVLISFY